MKIPGVIALLFTALALGTELCSPFAHAETKKLPRAMVIEGANFNTAMFIGMLDGAMEAGWTPNALVSTCGASVAAALVQAIPDPVERRKFLVSKEFFTLLQSPTYQTENGKNALSKMLELKAQGLIGEDLIPSIFDPTHNIMFVPEQITAPRLDRKFTVEGIRAVMVATQLSFHMKDADRPRNGEKLYQETYFTDPETALLLGNFNSPIAKLFPESAVQAGTQVITDRGLLFGVRASVSDPYLMNPLFANGTYYLGGFVDLFPLEVAKEIADEVMVSTAPPFDWIEQTVSESVFHFNMNVRIHQINEKAAHLDPSEIWLDLSDVKDVITPQDGFTPQVKVEFSRADAAYAASPLLAYLLGVETEEHLRIRSGVPEDFNEFVRISELLWRYGHERAIEAVNAKKSGKKIKIRQPY